MSDLKVTYQYFERVIDLFRDSFSYVIPAKAGIHNLSNYLDFSGSLSSANTVNNDTAWSKFVISFFLMGFATRPTKKEKLKLQKDSADLVSRAMEAKVLISHSENVSVRKILLKKVMGQFREALSSYRDLQGWINVGEIHVEIAEVGLLLGNIAWTVEHNDESARSVYEAALTDSDAALMALGKVGRKDQTDKYTEILFMVYLKKGEIYNNLAQMDPEGADFLRLMQKSLNHYAVAETLAEGDMARRLGVSIKDVARKYGLRANPTIAIAGWRSLDRFGVAQVAVAGEPAKKDPPPKNSLTSRMQVDKELTDLARKLALRGDENRVVEFVNRLNDLRRQNKLNPLDAAEMARALDGGNEALFAQVRPLLGSEIRSKQLGDAARTIRRSLVVDKPRVLTREERLRNLKNRGMSGK